MMTDNKKLVVVLGATGAQGGPIAKYLLANSSHLFRIRAITRDVSKPSAVELASLGAEVVAADFSDEESLTHALKNANAIFAITNFWDQASYDLEVTQGKLVNKLASQVLELEHFLFSGLADGRQINNGQFQNILPYNAKAAIREDLKSYPELWKKTTEIWVAFYYQNWLKYTLVFGPQKDADGSFVLPMPFPGFTKVPSSWADDVAPVVDTLLRSGDKYHERTVSLVADLVSQEEMLSVWSEKLKVKAIFKEVSAKEYEERMKKSGLPENLATAVKELCEALSFEIETMEHESLVKGRDLIPADYKLKSWKDYVSEEDWSSML